jgi:RNA polymerase sigma factor (sigma-70 family)
VLTSEENDIINNVKTKSCNESLKTLISRHSGICYNLVLKYKKYIHSKNCDFQDLIDQKDYFIYQAALQYDNNRNIKFSTWLGNYVKYQCLNCRRSKFNYCILDEEASGEIERKCQRDYESHSLLTDKVNAVNDILNSLEDKRIKNIYDLRYQGNKKMTFKKISVKLGVSEPTVKKLFQKGKKIISKKMKKNT